MTDDPRAAAFEQAKEAQDSALAQLFIELAFLVPRGSDCFKGALGDKLKAWRDSVEALALLKAAPPGPTWQQGREQEYERWLLAVGPYLAVHGVNMPEFPAALPTPPRDPAGKE